MYMTIASYLEKTFESESRPSVQTVKNWIAFGKLSGKKIGGKWYISVIQPTGNEQADEILRRRGYL